MAKGSSYDEKSYEFAEHWLADYPQATDEDHDALARHVQEATEDWLRSYDEQIAERRMANLEHQADAAKEG